VLYYEKEKLSSERKALLKAQIELSDHAIARYTENMKHKIDQDPEAYIQMEPEKKNEA
jgi:hypothetical protein